ncbi:Rad52/Rad22 family DNA repair protein [Streptomyces sp. RKAG337]|uniref:Rad52/Rad22 family DNA repair protein n=1 Tax=Streptomyces sp. RKAG337 TaxID=2893404 RepID=UPI002033DD95|nr:Rad52/Rad22 family DNA repair protein [Streptomyces sp. RKAG337]MCM2427355.1 hypothetical protein [Streptomyces sp. RKAG337]
MNDLVSKLTDTQIRVLFGELNQGRVGFNQKGFAHVQQWDVRRFLIRVFGFGGYDTELLDVRCVREIEHKPNNPDGKSRWTVVYLVHQRLTIKAVNGDVIGRYEGVATGDAQNQPSLGDAHDGAVKEADSQSLKRAAVNLGDSFGLSLYNGGATTPVVIWSAAHPPKATSESGPAAVPTAPEDPPVLPDPEEATRDEAPADEPQGPADPLAPAPSVRRASTSAPAARQAAPAATGEDPADREAALSEMLDAAREIGFSEGVTSEFKKTFGHPIGQGTAAEYRQARDLMLGNSVAA